MKDVEPQKWNVLAAKLEWRIVKDVIAFLKENDIPYSVWNYLSTPNASNRFSLMGDETRKPLSKELLQVFAR